MVTISKWEIGLFCYSEGSRYEAFNRENKSIHSGSQGPSHEKMTWTVISNIKLRECLQSGSGEIKGRQK